MSKTTLVFSIALNGYQWLYKDYLRSHAQFASKHNYAYQAVTRPFITSKGVECCWLKLTLLQEALKAGYDNVLFVDADAYIQDNAPDLESNFHTGKYLYLARSYSGRFNSGVILIKNSQVIRTWLRNLLADRHQPISAANSVGWGENGHVIEHCKNRDFVSTLDNRWNNTHDPVLKDYIRHFSFGPLRQSLMLNLIHKCFSRLTSLFSKTTRVLQKAGLIKRLDDGLVSLTQRVLRLYPIFTSVDELSAGHDCYVCCADTPDIRCSKSLHLQQGK